MLNIRKLIFVYSLIFSLGAVPVVFAAEGSPAAGIEKPAKHQWREKMEQKIQEIYAQLNLTAEQKVQLDANKAKNRETRKVTFEKMRSYKEALNQELMKPELDMSKINAIQSQFKALQDQMADERLNSILEVRKILTAEQFSQFISLMEKHKSERFAEEK